MTFLSRAGSTQPQVYEDRFERTEGVVATRPGKTTILLDVNAGMYYTLNEQGARIWALLGEGSSVGAIVERLGEEYDVPVDQLVADVRALLGRLRAAKLIEAAGR